MAAGGLDVEKQAPQTPTRNGQPAQENADDVEIPKVSGWRHRVGLAKKKPGNASAGTSISDEEDAKTRPEKWSLGILNDPLTDEVPGSVLLLSKVSNRNEPLGLRHAPARTSTSSLPSPYPPSRAGSMTPHTPRTPKTPKPEKKKTSDGKIVLEPQPDDSLNDPLNWPTWRRDCALISLGFYCMLGGGMTPVLAAGFNDVAKTYDVPVTKVALTTGLYMMGLGLGSVVASPTAILFGKRPVYLAASIIFVLSSIWCALSPNYASLVVARIVQGFAVSPVECLPSATVAEIYFLHERAYRLGVYTLLLLGGKNLIPLVSAAIIESLGWRWVFWIVAMVVGFGGTLLFLFVPETFWDRTPVPKSKSHHHRPHLTSPLAVFRHHTHAHTPVEKEKAAVDLQSPTAGGVAQRRAERHARFAAEDDDVFSEKTTSADAGVSASGALPSAVTADDSHANDQASDSAPGVTLVPTASARTQTSDKQPPPVLKLETQQSRGGYFGQAADAERTTTITSAGDLHPTGSQTPSTVDHPPPGYTGYYSSAPPKSFVQTLKPYAGRLCHDNWFRVAARPFILFAYPSILWSTTVYALSVGWLIVLSESVSTIFESRASYHFTALQTGLVYLSPFIGGVLGTVVAGKVSDLIVRWMARRNEGVYEPEFRLVMAIPVALCTTIGLMGYGWAAEERDAWIVPTVFFGIIAFGCTLGSTTAITFAVDSYRQYAGEALVTLNFSKNIFHGLIFSLFFNKWLDADGSKKVFVALGGIQMACLLSTIPMYIYGKRARMWTVRKNLMEKF